ncbi:MAG: hypothetical protein ACYDA2_02030 [Acidimicrobiales bacterium]
MRHGHPLLAVAVLAVAAAACGSSAGSGAGTTTTRPPQPAGATPSAISRMVCSDKAEQEIAAPLGVSATVSTPTWVGHTYACQLTYPNGTVRLSVKELSSWAQTYAYVDQLGTTLGNKGAISGLGQGAFTTANGSVVVRKDWKVLLVDISGLPASFGQPPTSAADVAVTIADVILGCWAGD